MSFWNMGMAFGSAAHQATMISGDGTGLLVCARAHVPLRTSFKIFSTSG
jgi:hypothetical protein